MTDRQSLPRIISRAQGWWRQGKPHRPWLSAYFAAFCVLEIVATAFAAQDGYWTIWGTAPASLMFGIAAVLS